MHDHFPRHRHQLPQLDGRLFLSDGGLETTLIFHEGWELPLFAAFPLLESERGIAALRGYFDRYIPMAAHGGTGFILEAPTWRANPDWGAKLGYDLERLAEVNRLAVALLQDIATAHESEQTPMVVSGCVGPRGDGYDPGSVMRAEDAQAYHAWQIGVFKDAGVDLVSAYTLTNINEAVGVAAAAKAADMPCALSFTLETDGKLPTGESLQEAITVVDMETGASPAYYMINCAHPTHFNDTLEDGAPWMDRIRGLRANSSERSHAELDNAPDLDSGNPDELGAQYAALRGRFPHLTILGGCCGTDHRHLHSIAEACGTPSSKSAAAR
jgi:homocysteine S-methyltransferase